MEKEQLSVTNIKKFNEDEVMTNMTKSGYLAYDYYWSLSGIHVPENNLFFDDLLLTLCFFFFVFLKG